MKRNEIEGFGVGGNKLWFDLVFILSISVVFFMLRGLSISVSVKE